MKVRSDFITNSSSSSFLLSFKDENSIYETLKEQFPVVQNDWSAGENGYLEQLFDEIKNAHRLSRDEIKALVKSESFNIEWNFVKALIRKKNMTYEEAWDYIKTDEGQQVLADKCEEEINSILIVIGNDEVVVEVKHGDGGEGEDGVLEHDILPYLNCTVASFSHH